MAHEHSSSKDDIETAFEELLDDEASVEDAEELHDSEGSERTSQLQDGLEELQNLMGGLASRLLGPNAAKRMEIDPEKPVISPEVDRAIEDIGDTIGRFLTQAGDELKRAANKPAQDGRGDDPEGTEPDADQPELEGWSPLVIGARDDHLTPAYYSEELAAAIPNAALEIFARGAHCCSQVVPDQFNAVLARFLSAHSAA